MVGVAAAVGGGSDSRAWLPLLQDQSTTAWNRKLSAFLYREIFVLGEGPRSVRLLLKGDTRYSQASALLAPKHRVHTGRT